MAPGTPPTSASAVCPPHRSPFLVCPQDFTIPATAPGAVAAVDCQNGHFTRQCLITGFWAETADYSQCRMPPPHRAIPRVC